MAFPSFAWKYLYSSDVSNPPRRAARARGASFAGAAGARAAAAGVGPCGVRAFLWRARRHRLKRMSCESGTGRRSSRRRARGLQAFVRSSAWASERPPVGIPAGGGCLCVARREPRGVGCPPPRRAARPGRGRRRCCAHGLSVRSARGAGVRFGALSRSASKLRHRIMEDYPLNLSISLSGGKETNRDAPSNGE